jgi:hypothetical protein
MQFKDQTCPYVVGDQVQPGAKDYLGTYQFLGFAYVIGIRSIVSATDNDHEVQVGIWENAAAVTAPEITLHTDPAAVSGVCTVAYGLQVRFFIDEPATLARLFRDGAEVRSGAGSEFTITFAQGTDAGVYTCNADGKLSNDIQLVVTGT